MAVSDLRARIGLAVFYIVLIVGLGSVGYVNYPHVTKHVAEFETSQCFERDGLREPWQVGPDGIIVFKGYLKYLVLQHFEANLSGGGTKIGTEEDIVEFDAGHHQVRCPIAWQQHTHTQQLQDEVR